MKRVLFRVDAGRHIGLGHLLRCRNLAYALKELNYTITFICREHEGVDYSDFLQDFQLIKLKRSTISAKAGELVESKWLGRSQEEDFTEVAPFIDHDIAVIDHYSIDKKWESKVREKVQQIFVIDDLLNRDHDCDVIINPNNFSLAEQKVDNLLQGGKYSLISEEFLKRRENFEYSPKREEVLLNLGGVVDPDILERILPMLKEEKLIVIVNDKNFIKRISLVYPNVEFLTFVNNMPDIYTRVKYVIGAAGTSFWERCCLGVPSILLKTAPNQDVVVKTLESSYPELVFQSVDGLIQNIPQTLGSLTDTTRLEEISSFTHGLCHGLGVNLVLNKVFGEETLSLRDAKAEDCELLFKWQVKKETRQFSRNPNPPKWDEHEQWFHSSLASSSREIFMVDYKSVSLGYLRLDYKEGIKAEVSIIINPNFQGAGIGPRALKLLVKNRPDVHFTAFIKPENIGSKKAFLKAGFTQIDEENFEFFKQGINHE